MTTVQVCCHIVIPTIILAVDVSYTPHNEPLGLTFCCIVTPVIMPWFNPMLERGD